MVGTLRTLSWLSSSERAVRIRGHDPWDGIRCIDCHLWGTREFEDWSRQFVAVFYVDWHDVWQPDSCAKVFFPGNEVPQPPLVLKRSLLEKPSGLCKKSTTRTTSSLLANTSSSSSLSPTPLSKTLKEDHCHMCEHPITHVQEAIQCDTCGHVVHRWSLKSYPLVFTSGGDDLYWCHVWDRKGFFWTRAGCCCVNK